jgi:hypothetical protein
MQALLGKITGVSRPSSEGEPASSGAGHLPLIDGGASRALEVKFKAACVLPQRGQVPEWLKDQVLTIQRTVADPREIGEAGDSLVLTPTESDRWLSPLSVTPSVVSGALPPTLQIRLLWWKDEKLPEYTVRANGHSVSGQFTKEGEVGVATVETGSFFSFSPALPVAFEVTCDKLTAECAVLPAGVPFARKLKLQGREKYRIESDWYRVGITGQAHAGGIESLEERGREVDHFRGPQNVIGEPCEYAGHSDRVGTGGWRWFEKLAETGTSCSGARREADAVRLELDALLDEGQNLRSRVVYTLFERLPLLLMERSFQLHKGKGGDKDKEKDEKPKEPIDDMKAVRYGFRAAWKAEGRAGSGSRVLCLDGDHLVVVRPGQSGEFIHHGHWTMSGGWAMAEHPLRREYTLYLFDPKCPPYLAAWLGEHTLTFEPSWPHLPMRPEESIGFSTGLCVGEAGGASAEGAWIACRAPRSEGGMQCAVVARTRDSESAIGAGFVLGAEKQEARLERVLLPGIGFVSYATAVFPHGGLDQPFDVAVGRINRRV